METKSRYEVISDLEKQKRDLILERDGLNDKLLIKQKNLKDMERNKADNNLLIDRKIEDIKEDIINFKNTIGEREETISELIKSVDESLIRLGKISNKKE